MRRSPSDEFIYYDPCTNTIILRSRDMNWNGRQEYFHFDGERSWWNYNPDVPTIWELLDRVPEGSFSEYEGIAAEYGANPKEKSFGEAMAEEFFKKRDDTL